MSWRGAGRAVRGSAVAPGAGRRGKKSIPLVTLSLCVSDQLPVRSGGRRSSNFTTRPPTGPTTFLKTYHQTHQTAPSIKPPRSRFSLSVQRSRIITYFGVHQRHVRVSPLRDRLGLPSAVQGEDVHVVRGFVDHEGVALGQADLRELDRARQIEDLQRSKAQAVSLECLGSSGTR